MSIKIFSKYVMTAVYMMLLGSVSFFVYNEIKEAKKVLIQKAEFLAKADKISLGAKPSDVAQNKASSLPSEPFQEGKHYKKFAAKITTQPLIQRFVAENPGKIQIIEFFNYGCFWCERLHSDVNNWVAQKPQNVVFYRFPIIFNKGWEVLAKAYFMVDMLGQHETLDAVFFKAVHKENIDLSNEAKLKDFFAKHGVDNQKFTELYHSFTVSRALSQTNALANAYQLTASPAFILNMPSGSYLVTASMAGTEKAVLEVVNYLLQKETSKANQAHSPKS